MVERIRIQNLAETKLKDLAHRIVSASQKSKYVVLFFDNPSDYYRFTGGEEERGKRDLSTTSDDISILNNLVLKQKPFFYSCSCMPPKTRIIYVFENEKIKEK
jgi:hypothetical protein